MIAITIGLLVVAFMAKAFMDLSAEDKFDWAWLNKTESWQNKYAFPLVKGYRHWYYFGIIKPVYKERFMFSSTVFVFATDGWHMFQFIFLNCMFVALALNMGELVFLNYLVVRMVYGVVFNAFHR